MDMDGNNERDGSSEELYHYGILGMKWGVRRTRTPLGRGKTKSKKNVSKKPAEAKKTKKTKIDPVKSMSDEAKKTKKTKIDPVKSMSDEDLNTAIKRLELEKRYRDLSPQKVSFGKKMVNDVLIPSATNAGKQLLTDYAVKQGKKLLGLDTKTADDLDSLKKEAATLQSQKLISTLKTEKAAGKW